MMQERDLPPSWAWARFGDVAKIESNLVDPSDHQDAPHVAPNHIESGTGVLLPYTTIRSDKVTSPKHTFRPGQIVYSKIRPYLAKAVLVDFAGLCSADMYPVSSRIDASYLHRWLISPEFTELVSENQGRTLLPKVNQDALVQLPVPVPPLREQHRITAKLESLTTRSRRAKEALDAVPDLLEQFRQSVLAAAFRGDLTVAWREKTPDVEPAEVLLQRIRAERRRRWEEAELAKMRAKGKVPGDRWKAKYEEPEPVDVSELPELPEGWAWATSAELLSFVTSGSRGWAEFYSDAGPLFIRIGNLEHHTIELDLSDRQCVTPPPGAEGSRTRVEPGDVLISITADVGMVGIVRDGIGEAYVNQHIALARPVSRELSEYLALFLSTPTGGKHQLVGANRGVTKAGLGLQDITSVKVAVAPLREQAEIVAQLQRFSERIRFLSEARSKVESQLGDLDRSVLSKAFRGELVPQDPTDEPASLLLDRLRAEATDPTGKKPKRGKRHAAATAHTSD
ncbi:restriction endonuclease subunit S [Polyangium jinanense]|uniref:Restriction endonuclease subunit S n=1 Tax=Polyangium jinanense TaxID=2829994 RepID=A0A9X4AXA6_9BACT|nr:restriction endonuclease subunit S [Polyangium jinanense]MDC3988189.1 restriction endonuclease subunit S [Polyangium jinanense]